MSDDELTDAMYRAALRTAYDNVVISWERAGRPETIAGSLAAYEADGSSTELTPDDLRRSAREYRDTYGPDIGPDMTDAMADALEDIAAGEPNKRRPAV